MKRIICFLFLAGALCAGTPTIPQKRLDAMVKHGQGVLADPDQLSMAEELVVVRISSALLGKR